MVAYRKIFPGLQNCIYADTAAAGLMFKDLLEWRKEHDQELIINGSALWPEKNTVLKETRSTLKNFFLAGEAEVALIPNFSLGLNLLLENQNPSQRVLLVKNDYPSVNWPFENRGFDIRYLNADENLEEQILERSKSEQADILALSSVQWLNGLMIRPGFLKELKDSHPSLLIIVDGTQHCGAFALEFDSSGIDVLGASGYKWLLGGYGNGFMMIRPEAQSRFSTPTAGFNSVEGDLGQVDYPFWKRLEPGHLDSQNFGSLKQGLELISAIGIEKITTQNQRLSAYALRELGTLNLLQPEVLAREEHGSIFRVEAGKSTFELLRQEGVKCSWRAGAIRLSFHFYNTEEEIDRIVEIIKSAD